MLFAAIEDYLLSKMSWRINQTTNHTLGGKGNARFLRFIAGILVVFLFQLDEVTSLLEIECLSIRMLSL